VARFTDPHTRLLALAESLEPRFAREFIKVVEAIKRSTNLDRLAELLERGDVRGAIEQANRAALRLGNTWGEVYGVAGAQAAEQLERSLGVLVEFNRVHVRALSSITENSLRLVRALRNDQESVVRAILVDGTRRGLNPRAVAREFRDVIGLAPSQVRAVQNFRRALEELDSTALRRALRDRRFDSTIRRAIESGRSISPEQIDRMVGRYQERYIKYRAEVISRTETLRAVHEGTDELYRQAVGDGILAADELTRTWFPTPDGRTRGHHASMAGQERRLGEVFISGLGNALRYPADPRAPGEDSIQCRCSVTTEYTDTLVRQNAA